MNDTPDQHCRMRDNGTALFGLGSTNRDRRLAEGAGHA